MSKTTLLAWLFAGAVLLFSVAVLAHGLRLFFEKRRMKKARRIFRPQRERLEAKFFDLAANSGKPRGLTGVACDFSDAVCFARDRKNGAPLALVAVTISFEAIEGGGMEEVEAVSNLRAATGIFYFEGNCWSTRGRVLFNLDPTEAIDRMEGVMEKVSD